MIAIALAACGPAGELGMDFSPPASRRPLPPTFNERVLALIATYPDGGFGGYAWPSRRGMSGTTRDLAAGGTVFARGGDGNHCVGVTLEVFWRALDACPGRGPSAAKAQQLKRTWYVPTDRGAGSAAALPSAGLGTPIALDDARPGDFVQAWRADGLGHSMVFLAWDRDDAGTITGIHYWSSQPWTGGIGRAWTAVGDDAEAFDPAQIHVARARCP